MDNPEKQLAAATPSPPKAGFLTLPPEIRNMIYKYLLVLDKSISMSGYALTQREARLNNGLPESAQKTLGIARTCKQIHDETLPIYFGMKEFEFYSTDDIGKYLRYLSKDRRQLLRKIKFTYIGWAQYETFALLGVCLNLETLRIGLSWSTLSRSRGDRSDLFATNGVRQLEKNRGCKEVGFDNSATLDHLVTKENISKFEAMLKEELCKDRKEVKKRAPKGQGKKALAAAKKKGGSGSTT
jgi:hypothetical protein